MLCLVTQSFPTLCNPMDCSLPGFSWQEYWSGFPPAPPGNLLHPGIEPMSPTLQANSLPSEPPGKPMNTGVGRLSLLQDIFSTQEWNWGRSHCRWVLYQLSYQGSPQNVYPPPRHFLIVFLCWVCMLCGLSLCQDLPGEMGLRRKWKAS